MNEPENTLNGRVMHPVHCLICQWEGNEPVLRSTDAPSKCPLCWEPVGAGPLPRPKSPAKVMRGPLDVEPVNPFTIELARMAVRAQEFTIKNYEQAPENRLKVEIQEELSRAKAKFPEWPTDPMHAVGILGEEYGEVIKDCLQLVYEPSKTNLENLRKETIQLAAMCRRFLESLDRYEFKPSAQHKQ